MNQIMLLICLGLSLQPRAQSTSSPTAPTHKAHYKPRTFRVDDFPVTDEMFGSDSDREFASGPLHSSDMAWFTNNHIGQTLVILIYTDNFRNAFFLFRNDDIPAAIIDSMELHLADGNLATHTLKRKYFHGLLRWAKPAAPKYFISVKGFSIGDSSGKAIRTYGKPDKRTITDGVELLYWSFKGESNYDGRSNLHGKPLAADSFGHEVTMCFRNNQLIGLIYGNDIP